MVARFEPDARRAAVAELLYLLLHEAGLPDIFVSDEIYNDRDFLKKMDKVYSVKNLNLKTLKVFLKAK